VEGHREARRRTDAEGGRRTSAMRYRRDVAAQGGPPRFHFTGALFEFKFLQIFE
jgi:hypothetical protein